MVALTSFVLASLIIKEEYFFFKVQKFINFIMVANTAIVIRGYLNTEKDEWLVSLSCVCSCSC